MRGLRVATWDEVLAYGQGGLRKRGLLPPMRGGVGYALVGSVGALSAGTSGTAVTPAFGTGESRTAGNLLVCWLAGNTATLPTTPTGWSIADQVAGLTCTSTIYYKIAAGADAAPTIALASGTIWDAQVAEFSGNAATSPLDQHNKATATTATSVSVTNPGADVAAGELVLYVVSDKMTAGVQSFSDALNNGATTISTSNNSGVSSGAHHDFGYGITTGNSVADSDTLTISSGTPTSSALVLASFLLAAGAAAAIPDVNMAPMRAPGT